jgi:hypothetical protein
MKYPFHTVSQPVSGSEAEKLSQTIQSGGHVANEVALALMKKLPIVVAGSPRMPQSRVLGLPILQQASHL